MFVQANLFLRKVNSNWKESEILKKFGCEFLSLHSFFFLLGGEKNFYPKTISRLIRIVQTFHDVLVNLKKFLKLFLQKQMPLFSCHIWHCGRQFLRVKNILQLLEVTTIFLKKKREVMENFGHPQKHKGKKSI